MEVVCWPGYCGTRINPRTRGVATGQFRQLAVQGHAGFPGGGVMIFRMGMGSCPQNGRKAHEINHVYVYVEVARGKFHVRNEAKEMESEHSDQSAVRRTPLFPYR